MSDNPAVDMLSREHKVILKVVFGLHGLAGQIREGRTVDVSLLRETVEFMREFADKCHHAKEEDILFPALVEHGVPLHGCPLDALLHEHKEGRRLVGELEQAIDAFTPDRPETGNKLISVIEAIKEHYPNHIWKEDEMVFPMTGKLVPPSALRRIYDEFEEVEAQNPPGIHERFHRFADRISSAS